MAETLPYNTRVYTDFQGLKQLQTDPNKAAAKKEVASQFEAILMQMVFHSMRDANKAFSKDSLFGDDQMDMYQDMFDKQLSLLMSSSSTGFAAIVEKSMDQIDKNQGTQAPSLNTFMQHKQDDRLGTAVSLGIEKDKAAAQLKPPAAALTPVAFLKKIWPLAQKAAQALGLAPEVLAAQAVLETNWGKSVLANDKTGSSHNVFNIKADSNWQNKTISVNSLEEKNHVLTKQKSNFRSYDSYEDSFKDYVKFLKENGRYHNALQKTDSPSEFLQALQQSGYATDSQYASKVLSVFSSPLFHQSLKEVK